MRHLQISVDGLVTDRGDPGQCLTPLHRDTSFPRCLLSKSTIGTFLLGMIRYHFEICKQVCLAPPSYLHLVLSKAAIDPNKLRF